MPVAIDLSAMRVVAAAAGDSGPELFAYERPRQFQHYSMGDFRGVKRDAWEGRHRVPFVARWPRRIGAGSSSGEIICQTDLMATLATIVGQKGLPASAAEDSFDISPALFGRSKPTRPIRPATILHRANGFFAIRQGPWVFIDNPTGNNNHEPEWLRQERGYQPHTFAGELYNLRDDRAERKNLHAERPEIVGKLKALFKRHKSAGQSRF